MRKFILIIVLVVLGNSGACADTDAEHLAAVGYAAYLKQDYKTALNAYRSAAQQGAASAQNNLGKMYFYGQGVLQDYAEAAKWFQLAAEQGEYAAQFNLGLMYDNGRQGIPQSNFLAVKWYRLAAQQGYDKAQNNLGLMYKIGQGVPQDYVKAHLWFNLAAASGDANAIKSRDLVEGKMTPAQIAEAQRMARDCTASKLKGCN